MHFVVITSMPSCHCSIFFKETFAHSSLFTLCKTLSLRQLHQANAYNCLSLKCVMPCKSLLLLLLIILWHDSQFCSNYSGCRFWPIIYTICCSYFLVLAGPHVTFVIKNLMLLLWEKWKPISLCIFSRPSSKTKQDHCHACPSNGRACHWSSETLSGSCGRHPEPPQKW